jgi:F-type H+-transporting ATPase subunit a
MEEISIKAEKIFSLGSFNFTNSLALSLVALVFLVILGIIVGSKMKYIPGKIQNIVELALEKLLALMESTLGSREKAEKYLPLVATTFIFIFTSNLLGIFPGVGSLVVSHGGKASPFFRSPASDLNFTLGIAIITVVMTNIFAVYAVGLLTHLNKFFNFKNPIAFFVGILELISELAKTVSLSFRLFGNVFAGEVLLMIIFYLVPYVVPIPFLFLEMFVGFIQSFVFSMLILVSLALHTTAHEH